jgi:hypothetical protein
MKKTMYTFAGRDYEEGELLTFTFRVQRCSIENFLNIRVEDHWAVRECKLSISDHYVHDTQPTFTDGKMRDITIRTYARRIYIILKEIGYQDHSTVIELSAVVRNNKYRAERSSNKRAFRFVCFDSKTKEWRYTGNSPVKMNGKQQVINGKLWRKIA